MAAWLALAHPADNPFCDEYDQMVKLKTRDGEIIEASRAVACRCVTICNMLEDAGGDDDVPQLPLLLVDARALRHVLNYCTLRHRVIHSHPRDLGVLLRLPLEELFELVAATNFLEMPQLFELSCGAVAEHIRRSSSAESIRSRFGIAPDMSGAMPNRLRIDSAELLLRMCSATAPQDSSKSCGISRKLVAATSSKSSSSGNRSSTPKSRGWE